ncbi:MAG: hypothetical protein AAFZ01_04605 [Pseudomonadota bacterium]
MRQQFRVVFLSTTVAISGCAGLPLVDNYTDFSTFDIVHFIRCEARDVIEKYKDDKKYNTVKKIYDARLGVIKTNTAELAKRRADLSENLKKRDILLNDLARHRQRFFRAEREKQVAKAAEDREFKVLEEQMGQAPNQEIPQAVLATYQRAYKRAVDADNRVIELAQEGTLLIKQLENETGDIKELSSGEKTNSSDKKDLAKQYKKYIAFRDSTIALRFKFDLSEQNSATGDASFTWPIHLGTFTLAIDGGDTKKRDTLRVVQVGGKFGELLEVECSDRRQANSGLRAAHYPITGEIGVGELVSQYLKLLDKDISIQEHPTAGRKMTETITFTTTLNGNVKPSLKLTTVNNVSITANGGGGATREDIHEVAIEIAPKPSPSGASPNKAEQLVVTGLPDVNVYLNEVRDVIAAR